MDTKLLNQIPEGKKKTFLPNLYSEVMYANVFPNVDLQYQLNSENVKENIVIKDKTDVTTINFILNTKKLIPKLLDTKEVVFYDKQDNKTEIFRIDAPYMVDAKGADSNDVKVELIEDKSQYLLKLTPRQEWLQDPKRVYPVTLDPTVKTDTTEVQDSFVYATMPTSNFDPATVLKVGNNGSGIYRSYVKFTLPTLSSSSLITDVKLYLALSVDAETPRQVNVQEVTSSWDASTITWNTQPICSSLVEDYKIVNAAALGGYTFDITNSAKKWYSTGQNNGLVIKTEDESTGLTQFCSSVTTWPYASAVPNLAITYTNNLGLEDYWSYHSQDVGRAGTVHVNDATGNLVVTHEDTETTGNRMPVTIQHAYNSGDSGTDIGYGKGWVLNLSQRVRYEVIEGISYYKYFDEDGTIHHLKYVSTNTYEDESGIGTTLTYDANSTTERYKIKDKGDNQLSFDTSGDLVYIRDNNNNTIQISYGTFNGKKRITSVKDGVGRTFTFTIDSTSARLTSIKDPAGRVTSYQYDAEGQMTKVTYPDAKYSTYTYHSTLDKLSSATNIDGYKVSVSYFSVSPYRISKISESHTNGTLGTEMNFTYSFNTTTVTDKIGRKNIYQFNDLGNTVSIQESKGYAEYYDYYTSDKTKNNLRLESKLQKMTLNYLQNHNIEQTSDWSYVNGTSSTGSGAINTDPNYAYLGKQSLKITKTNNTNFSYYQQTLNLTKGKTYTFSGYIKTQGVTSSNAGGALLRIHYQDSTGEWKDILSKYVNGTKDWERYQVTLTLPSDAASTSVLVRVAIDKESGTAYFDSLQLEEGKIANRYNLVENADFNFGTEFWPTSSNLTTNDTVVTVDSRTAFKMVGDATKNKNLKQVIPESGNKDDSFVIGGWAKANSVKTNYPRYYAYDIGFKNSTTNTYEWIPVSFNQDTPDWQYMSQEVKAPCAYSEISVWLLYYQNENEAYFDNIQLYKESFGDTYTYDENGNLNWEKDINGQISQYDYTNNNLTKVTDPNGNSENASYDAKHNLLSNSSAEGVKNIYTYDSYGNITSEQVGEGTTFIKSTKTYTSDGNYTASETDPLGNKTDNTWDTVKGWLLQEKDAEGNIETNTYDSNTNDLKTTSKNVTDNSGDTSTTQTVTNTYSYSNDKMTSITHNGFTYSFGYDAFGNNTTVSVAGNNLITNTYDLTTDKLTESTYGNGHKITNIFDNLDRIISKKYTNASGNVQERAQYEYDNSGNVGYKKDFVNNIDYRYIYDLADRLMKVEDSTGKVTKFEYDKNYNQSKLVEIIGGSTYTTAYGYDKDNRPTTVTTPGNKTLSTIYDSLGRIQKKSLSIGTGYNTTFNYLPGINGSSSTTVSSISNNGKAISYTYDKNGNIETITENGKTTKYYYNELNESVREDNAALNQTITYSYDVGGNILKKSIYPFTTGVLGTPTSTINYTYDSNWKDQMASYDGKSITYDAIGNPLTYDGYTFTWEEGRQLASINKTGLSMSFKYNDEGILTQKTVNGVTTTYHVVGDKVTYEKNATDEIYYSYDSENNLVSIKLNGVEYYYIRNVQGDIIGFVDGNGTQVVSYSYDSWGKLINIEGTLKDSLGKKNPYRYRGYRYDEETGLYYLNSRYYNPDWGRFINADGITGQKGDVLTHNMYAYCKNNPVNMQDPSGYFAWWVVGGSIGAVVGGAIGAYYSYKKKGKIDWRYVAAGAVGGALVGAGAGAVAHAFHKGYRIHKIGRLVSASRKGKDKGFWGVRYKTPKNSYRSIEFHTPHKGKGYHWQKNTWNSRTWNTNSKKAKRWTWYLKRIRN